MYPLLIFATGLVVGAAGVRLLKGADGSLKAKGDQAQDAVRGAAVSGLSAIERTSARLRAKLTPEPAEAAAEVPPASAAEEAPAEPPAAEAPAEAAASEPPPAPRPEGSGP